MMAVKFGIAIFPTDYTISMSELAPAVEQLGFESIWVAEHSHIPASRESRWPGGAELPKHYWHTLDPFVALTVAALASKTLRIATGICLVVQRDPIHTAKQVASLDHISNGRFLFGIGAGWNREEMADQLRALSHQGYSLFVTTSRRTGEAQLKILQEALTARSTFLWDGTGENPFMGMLALADAILVTSDSTNMMVEAAGTGKPVHILQLPCTNPKFGKLIEKPVYCLAHRARASERPSALTERPRRCRPEMALGEA